MPMDLKSALFSVWIAVIRIRGNGFESRWGYKLVLEKARNHGLFRFRVAKMVTDLVTCSTRTPAVRRGRC
jgi:hypothetical protein